MALGWTSMAQRSCLASLKSVKCFNIWEKENHAAEATQSHKVISSYPKRKVD
jgi:hypothetical protein